jgi:hypothetical protein
MPSLLATIVRLEGFSERAGSFLLSLRNDVVYESIFERDWREGRVPLQAGTPPECGSRLGVNDEEDEEASSKMQRGQLNSRGASPASSIRSRISAASFRSPRFLHNCRVAPEAQTFSKSIAQRAQLARRRGRQLE